MSRTLLASVLTLLVIPDVLADWREPNPWRRDALLEGRSEDYDSESWLNRFSYRQLSSAPAPYEPGLAGSVGSVTSERSLVDIHFHQRLQFDNPRHAFLVTADRHEDFDGSYSRQLVGYAYQPSSDWELAIQGDITGDKAETDVYLQSRWQPDEDNLWRFAVVFPDYYLNDKTNLPLEYTRQPVTLFSHLRLGNPENLQAELAVNHTPQVELENSDSGLVASGRQTRVLAGLHAGPGAWRLSATARGEYTERDFDFTGSDSSDFRRRLYSVTLEARYRDHAWQPAVGVHHLHLDEEGYFGSASQAVGELRRNEPMVYADIRLAGGPRHHWEPAVYISRPDIDQNVDSPDWSNRDEDEWRGKVSLPWRYLLERDSGALLTVSGSMNLHEFGFGGGNVQIHWPL
jgi:hypothetical protein